MKSRRELQWTEAGRAALEAQRARANGRRTSRLLSVEEIERCAAAALEAELGFAWVHGGDAPDARSLTTLCLCAVSGGRLTIGVAAAHGAATPAGAWPDLKTWDRYRDAVNAAACGAWAGRARDDRVSFALSVVVNKAPATEAELLAAVLKNPSDDAPRLVLADWLTERGDPRGELISVQCQLARGGGNEDELLERERALLTEHGAAWIGGAEQEFLQVRFARGFVESVEVLDAAALPQLEAFFQREPITELIFTSSRLLDGARFAQLEWLDRLRSLEFRARSPSAPGSLSAEQLALVLGSRRLRGLERLALSGQRLRATGLAILSEHAASSLPALDALAFDDDVLTAAAITAHAEQRWVARLSQLSFSNDFLRPDAVEALAFARRPGQLVRLGLGHNPLGNPGAGILARAPRLQSLRHLSLPGARIGPVGVDALLGSEHLRQLESLELEGNPIGSSTRDRVDARFSRTGRRARDK